MDESVDRVVRFSKRPQDFSQHRCRGYAERAEDPVRIGSSAYFSGLAFGSVGAAIV